MLVARLYVCIVRAEELSELLMGRAKIQMKSQYTWKCCWVLICRGCDSGGKTLVWIQQCCRSWPSRCLPVLTAQTLGNICGTGLSLLPYVEFLLQTLCLTSVLLKYAWGSLITLLFIIIIITFYKRVTPSFIPKLSLLFCSQLQILSGTLFQCVCVWGHLVTH